MLHAYAAETLPAEKSPQPCGPYFLGSFRLWNLKDVELPGENGSLEETAFEGYDLTLLVVQALCFLVN